MTEPLFYSEVLADTGAVIPLTGDEARHAAASRRLQAGDTLWLFDGRGGLARATLLQVTARGRTLELRVEERHTEPHPRPAIHLACALPKGDRQSVLLDMATQLGMARFTPLICERSVVKPGANSTDRWRRICLEACKQSRRTHLPELSPPATPREVVARKTANETIWIAHPSTGAISVSSAIRQGDPERVTILIGPEGGFTETEVGQAVAAGGQKIALGAAILRIETAAIALTAALTLAGGTRAL
ncbi:MAG: 16S rRNA (uracil(1498)-N(3))-methyltransferase [Gammaproteobacteria bacterium]|nr:16S rRNA (uracil(1498)-N(3))-methyltransferase [Gammaproteobacteria bacterium]